MVADMVPLISGTTCMQTSAMMEMRGQGTDVAMTAKLRLDGRAQGEAPLDPMCALRYAEMREGSTKILGIAMMEMTKMTMAAVKSAKLSLP